MSAQPKQMDESLDKQESQGALVPVDTDEEKEDSGRQGSGFWGDKMLTQWRRRTVVNVLRTWKELKGTARAALGSDYHPDLPREEQERLRRQIRECVHGKGGEVAARARAVELGTDYLDLSAKGKERFLSILANDFGVDYDHVYSTMDALRSAPDAKARALADRHLRDALMPDTVRLFRMFGALPDGVKFLVDMRSDMLPLTREKPELAILEHDLKRLLASWFDISLLDMEEINWNASAALLERLIAYEAVHKIRSWSDLKNRLDSDRRCFAFFHYKMPQEPLIFVEVALVNGLAGNVQELLDESTPVGNPKQSDTAIFYSISNAQKGLAGISFGNFLIKRVVDRLSREFKNLKHFATLSPVPGLMNWLTPLLEAGDDSIFLSSESKELKRATGEASPSAAIRHILSQKDWITKDDLAAVAKPVLLRLCAHYLLREKRKGTTALDPVAHFHLTNGARLESINWAGDLSAKGLRQSAGIMVNYYYKLDDIDDNHETYVSDNRVVASRAVRGLLK